MNRESAGSTAQDSSPWLAAARGDTGGAAGTQTGQTPAMDGSDTGVGAGALGQTAMALIAVIGLILLAAWLFKRFGGARGEHSDRLRVVASRGLGQRERVVVVEIEDRWLVLGVTAHNVRTLDSMPAPPPDPNRPPAANPSFGEAFATQLRQARSRFGRGSRE